MTDKVTLQRLEKRATQADEMIALLRRQIAEVKKVACVRCFSDESQRLKHENGQLTAEIQRLKDELIKGEIRNGVKQIPLPTKQSHVVKHSTSDDVIKTGTLAKKDDPISKKEGGISKVKKTDAVALKESGSAEEANLDVGRLDMRVGLIVSARKHPDADSLYVEEVDLAEEGGRKRTVVSGLVRFVPLADMQNRIAVFLCNLKPAKMRGVLSEAMVMCASTPEKVEILQAPEGSVPGDKVTCEGFVSNPDKELNPKKKIFERIAPELKTNSERVATFRGVPLMVKGKGTLTAPSLANVQIK